MGSTTKLQPSAKDRWLTTEELMDELRLNRQAIREFRLMGCFVAGTHFIKKTKGPRSPLIWDANAVVDALRDFSRRNAPEIYEEAKPQ